MVADWFTGSALVPVNEATPGTWMCGLQVHWPLHHPVQLNLIGFFSSGPMSYRHFRFELSTYGATYKCFSHLTLTFFNRLKLSLVKTENFILLAEIPYYCYPYYCGCHCYAGMTSPGLYCIQFGLSFILPLLFLLSSFLLLLLLRCRYDIVGAVLCTVWTGDCRHWSRRTHCNGVR